VAAIEPCQAHPFASTLLVPSSWKWFSPSVLSTARPLPASTCPVFITRLSISLQFCKPIPACPRPWHPWIFQLLVPSLMRFTQSLQLALVQPSLLIVCIFDPGYIGCVGDETLLAIAANCLKLRVWHLVDMASLGSTRGEPEDDGCTKEDARISKAGSVDFFAVLALLQELVLDVYQHVREVLRLWKRFIQNVLSWNCLNWGSFMGFVWPLRRSLMGLACVQAWSHCL